MKPEFQPAAKENTMRRTLNRVGLGLLAISTLSLSGCALFVNDHGGYGRDGEFMAGSFLRGGNIDVVVGVPAWLAPGATSPMNVGVDQNGSTVLDIKPPPQRPCLTPECMGWNPQLRAPIIVRQQYYNYGTPSSNSLYGSQQPTLACETGDQPFIVNMGGSFGAVAFCGTPDDVNSLTSPTINIGNQISRNPPCAGDMQVGGITMNEFSRGDYGNAGACLNIVDIENGVARNGLNQQQYAPQQPRYNSYPQQQFNPLHR